MEFLYPKVVIFSENEIEEKIKDIKSKYCIKGADTCWRKRKVLEALKY